jgi:hypothetical protein
MLFFFSVETQAQKYRTFSKNLEIPLVLTKIVTHVWNRMCTHADENVDINL